MPFAPTDDGGLAGLLAGVRKRDPYAERRKVAQQLMLAGGDTSPVQSPWQGAGRLAQALAGGLEGYMADRDEKKAETKLAEQLAGIEKITDPNERIAAYTKISPDVGMRGGIQLAVEQAKQAAQQKALQTGAGAFGASFNLPQAGGAPAPLQGGSPNANAIAATESGGQPNNGYGAIGPPADAKGSRAIGRYQVMDYNVGPWTKEILGREMSPQEFLANPEAQNKVFEGKFGQYVTQFGSPQAASRAWFAGPGGMNNPNARDVNGMTTRRYEQQFNQNLPPEAQGAPPMQQPPAAGGLQINMPGPGAPGPMPPQGQIPQQGSWDGTPPQPSPQGVSGPTLTAPPAVPDVPRPQPTPQMIQQYQQRYASGDFGTNPAEAGNRARAAMDAELDRQWGVDRERAKMQYTQDLDAHKDERTRSQPSRTEIEKLHTARSEAVSIASALNDFQKEFKNTGTWGAIKSVAGATTPVNTAYNTAALLAKGEQLFNLGVLNGPDLEIIRRTLPDPSTAKGALTSNQDMSAAVGKVVDLLQTRLAAREKQLGMPATDVRGMAAELRATQPGAQQQAPAGQFVGPDGRTISMQDIEETARNRGMDPQAVIDRLQLRPVGR